LEVCKRILSSAPWSDIGPHNNVAQTPLVVFNIFGDEHPSDPDSIKNLGKKPIAKEVAEALTVSKEVRVNVIL